MDGEPTLAVWEVSLRTGARRRVEADTVDLDPLFSDSDAPVTFHRAGELVAAWRAGEVRGVCRVAPAIVRPLAIAGEPDRRTAEAV